ncbi:Hsp70 family protein [Pseudobacteriovorax antillogorgiicola]|uniref:Hsp70 protein n=1 Tax=Pseudobacteriovorax antillogorgiicola TaxID=1513793 RepID=A0A1Y6CDG1_9BACT|nr:Hsp70 family protein [Pseudobacteriovorax antillogorgiicola]TCS51715.1 Hsp70 protein [Pseudobacteriovorax antillogorgiicola]SMF49373.1 Hsp70 protein [Pseudobacteriovorax antillogorgiicola]
MSLNQGVGIDLGTSNTAVACYKDEQAQVIPVRQDVGLNEELERDSLPSVIFIPPGSNSLQFGEWAKDQGKSQPDRTVSSAKSWLCHHQVNREQKILPWNSDIPEEKLSPIEASQYILSFVKTAAESRVKDWSGVVITVPASFDENARRLTQQAARAAGFEQLTLLEEPLAAVYSWIADHHETWREQLSDGDMILVCDVGGGTSDFSLVAVSDADGELELERMAVGQHLLLGGDNMDLALAFRARMELENQGQTIDDWQFASLVYQVRQAKEALLLQADLPSITVGIASRGSDLFAKAISAEIQQAWIREMIIDGFFPTCARDARPTREVESGLKDFGLNYEQDPAITKHLAEFLSQAAKNIASHEGLASRAGACWDGQAQQIKPNKILFNGGVFNSLRLRQRLEETLREWNGAPVQSLAGDDCNLAVAKGAAFYSHLKTSQTHLRIKSGTANSYYLGIESSGMAIPGFKAPTKGLCLVPQGTEEGSHLRLPKRTFSLKAGQEVEFKFYSSRTRAGDQLGDEIANADRDLENTFRLKSTIDLNDLEDQSIPVWLDADIDELGTMTIKMQHTQSDKAWNLEFDVRSHD